MSKYIDAEKLIAEIERLIKVNKELKSSRFTEGIAAGYGDVLSAITSLQQDKETLELCSQIWWEEQGWIMIPPDATIEGIDSLLKQVRKKLQQEQPEVDLENYISGKLRELGADLINHKPYSFNRGLNVGKTNAYHDILDKINARKEE